MAKTQPHEEPQARRDNLSEAPISPKLTSAEPPETPSSQISYSLISNTRSDAPFQPNIPPSRSSDSTFGHSDRSTLSENDDENMASQHSDLHHPTDDNKPRTSIEGTTSSSSCDESNNSVPHKDSPSSSPTLSYMATIAEMVKRIDVSQDSKKYRKSSPDELHPSLDELRVSLTLSDMAAIAEMVKRIDVSQERCDCHKPNPHELRAVIKLIQMLRHHQFLAVIGDFAGRVFDCIRLAAKQLRIGILQTRAAKVIETLAEEREQQLSDGQKSIEEDIRRCIHHVNTEIDNHRATLDLEFVEFAMKLYEARNETFHSGVGDVTKEKLEETIKNQIAKNEEDTRRISDT
ncbi:uncharacterized protein APUU_10981A [Aspergillus puulaauensis]|uniref:Uncharacterized protein n=1 Tax=Aspergillus puulaauensis TaxID=1220207 RepID=A0A7R7XBQ1_9EURO|nr:uncharacterized protein APUU_10981A [Aspergillus puulaauensis]BCS18153.1 hypothetical protein APUU_10981A [Aspergillus puulaauensis]